MTRTPDEIKKGLECCMVDECFGERENCPYTAEPNLCVGVMCADALAYIQQLEAERDAAVALIPRACAYCKWYGTKHGGFFPDCKNPNGCSNVSGINTGWEWRGAQKEE